MPPIRFRRVNDTVQFVSAPDDSALASYPAMFMTQNKQKFYLATLLVEDVFPYSFVSRRDADPIAGFQRTLSEARAADIARYLDNGQGSNPTNVVLFAQPEAELQYSSKTKTIKFKRAAKSFLIIDGQHRLYGYGQTTKKHRVPVAIYEGLSRREEAALFIDINTNQRGVPAALLLDIKQVAEQENASEARLRALFDRLNHDQDSPFNGRLSPAASIRGKLSRVTFNRAVKEIIELPIMLQLSDEKRYTPIGNYFRAVERKLGEPALLFKSVYFEAFCALFDEATRISYAKHQNYKLESLEDVLAPLNNVDISGVLTGGKTKVTKGTILPALKHAISGQIDARDDMV